MPQLRSKRAHISQIKRASLSVVLSGFVLCAGATNPLKVQPLKADDFAAAQTKVATLRVPDMSGALHFERGQAFAVDGEPFGQFWLLPVRYESEDPIAGHFSPRCGVYLVWAKAKPQFVRTIGYERTSIQRCDKLSGVGFVEGPTKQLPRILLLYATSSPNYAVPEPVVLDWDSTKGQYVENEKLSGRLEDDDKATDIVSMKRQLKTYQ